MTSDSSLAAIQALMDVGRNAEARDRLVRYLATEADSVDGWCMLAECELDLGERERAIRAADQAVELAPEFDLAHRMRALALSADNPSAALDSAVEAVRLDPNDFVNHHTVALVLFQRPGGLEFGDVMMARRAALRAVELAPHSAAAHVMAGLTAGVLQLRDVERASYHEALRLEPDNAMAMNNLAAMDLQSRRTGRGIRRLVSGLRMDPQAEILHKNLDGVVRALIGRLFGLALVCACVSLAQLTYSGAWMPRVLIAAVYFPVAGLWIWQVMRNLPPGARMALRGFMGRAAPGVKAVAGVTLVLVAALVVVAALPGDIGTLPGRDLVVMARYLAVLLVLGVLLFVAWAFGKRND